MFFDTFLCFGRDVNYETFAGEANITTKAELALELWNYYLSNNIDSLKIIGTSLLHDAKEANDDYSEAIAYRIIGDYEIWNGAHEKGRKRIKASARYFLGLENHLLYSECLVSMGNSYFMEGDIDDAERAYVFALEAGKRSGDQSAWFAAELNLAKVYAAKGDTLKALNLGMHFKNEALRLYRYEAASNAYGFLYNMILNDSVLRKEYLEKSLHYARKCRALNQLSHALNNAAIEQFYDSNIDSAEVLFLDALNLRKKANNHRLICEGYMNLTQLYYGIGDTSNAMIYVDSLISHARFNTQNLSLQEGLIFRCKNLHKTDDCSKVEKLRLMMDSLTTQNAKLLDEVISIYEEELRVNEETHTNEWVGGILTVTTLFGLGWLIYKD